MTQRLALRILRRILQAWMLALAVWCVVIEDWLSAFIAVAVFVAVVYLLADDRTGLSDG